MKTTLFNTSLITLLIVIATTMQFCSSTKNSSSASTTNIAPENLVSYEKDIKPIMVRSCTPCHFPEKGRKKMLDTYASTKKNITKILDRIELPSEDIKYMPYKSKKPAVTKDEIALMKEWLNQNMPQ